MKKKLLAMLLAAVLAVGLLPGTAFAADEPTSGTCGDGVTWSYSDGTLTIQGTGFMANYGSDSEYTPWYDFCEQIHTVKIDDGVTSIGEFAFGDCSNLTSVTIPDSVTVIGSWAFEGCSSLTSVTIPASVFYINSRAFLLCDSLTSINVASGNSSYSSVDGVLFYANQTLLHTYPAGKSNASYSIPASVKLIQDSAFSDCVNLTSVTIPNGVTTIGNYAFKGCSGLTSVTIPSSVTAIGYAAFADCSGLTSVTIPNSVTTIGEWAFTGCGGLTGVTIPDSITTISQGVFADCVNLTSVTIPASVTSIGYAAFDECGNLKDVYYNGSESQWKQITVDEYNAPLTNAAINYPTTPTFTDVPAGEWFAEAVQWAADNGYIVGNNGKFSPYDNLTRGAIFTILARMDDVDTKGSTPWYQVGLDWAVENGVSYGENPEGNITREQLIVMLWRYEDEPDADTSVLDSYSDSASIDTWPGFPEAMAWAVETGIIQGGGNKLNPLADTTRAEGAMILQRYCEKLGK